MFVRHSSPVPFVSLFREGEGGEGGGTGQKPEKPTFDDAQQKHVNDLLAKERKDAEERTAARLKEEADAAKTKEAEDRERDEAAKRGEFDKVRGELEGKVTTAEGRATAAETERDALATYFDGQYKAAMTDLPEFITAFAPADDASFAEKSAWLTKAQEQAVKVGGEAKPGNRPNPKPGGDGNGIKEATEQMRGRVSI